MLEKKPAYLINNTDVIITNKGKLAILKVVSKNNSRGGKCINYLSHYLSHQSFR